MDGSMSVSRRASVAPAPPSAGSMRKKSMRVNNRRTCFDAPLDDEAERNRVAAKDRGVKLTDEQTLLATHVYDAHGGVAAHLDLMLQRLSLSSTSTGEELLQRHKVAQFHLPLAKYLDIVTEVFTESVAAEHLRMFKESLSSPEGSAALTKSQRAARDDAQVAYEALHGDDADRTPSAVQSPATVVSVFTAFTDDSDDGANGDDEVDSLDAGKPAKRRKHHRKHAAKLDSDVLRVIVEPMMGKSYDDFCQAIAPRDENPEFVRAFIRIGACRDDDMGYSLDTSTLIERCEAIGLRMDEQQAIVNLFDEDCSGDIDYEEFKAIMTGDLSGLHLNESVLEALGKLLGGARARRSSVADGMANSVRPSGGSQNGVGGAGAVSPNGGGDGMTPRNKSRPTLVSLSSRIGLNRGRNRNPSNRRRMTMMNMVQGTEDNSDEDDPQQREIRVLEGMQATVHTCEDQQSETEVVADRVNSFAREVKIRAAKDRQREHEEKYGTSPTRQQQQQLQLQQHHQPQRRKSGGNTSPSGTANEQATAAEQQQQQAAADGNEGEKLPLIAKQHRAGRPQKGKCTAKERNQQRKVVWTLDDHKRRQAARERLAGQSGQVTPRARTTVASMATEPHSTLRHTQGPLRPTLAAAMMPANTMPATSEGGSQTARVRPSRLAPVPARNAKASDATSSEAPSPAAPKTARTLGSREGLYRQILNRGEADAAMRTFPARSGRAVSGEAWERAYSQEAPRTAGRPTTHKSAATTPSKKQHAKAAAPAPPPKATSGEATEAEVDVAADQPTADDEPPAAHCDVKAS